MSNKLVLILLNLIIITLIGISAIKGLALTDNISINSVKETKDLDVEYQEVLNSYDEAELEFETAKKEQENAQKKFEQAKQEFDQIKNVNSYETLVELAAKREYNIEALWIKLGLIAENNELTHVFNITKSNTSNSYDINVELTGSYSGIRNFIDDIMMDMDLMFKAEDIVIRNPYASEATSDKDKADNRETPSSNGILNASFKIRNINIIM